MDFSLSSSPHSIPSLLLSPSTSTLPSSFALKFPDRKLRRPALVVAGAGFNHWEPSSSGVLNTPIELRSSVGKFLSNVFLNRRNLFEGAVAEELKLLADDLNAAVSRMFRSSRSDEACLHRRIAQLKEQDCQIAVEDVMYMLILHKFSEIRVPLIPKLSKCTYNGRLEIGPPKHWELESIHSLEVLQIIKQHVSSLIGSPIDSSINNMWATTEIQSRHIPRMYQYSIKYAYHLKSVSQRFALEQCLSFWASSSSDSDELRSYMKSFDGAVWRRCGELRSREAANLIKRHRLALFGDMKGVTWENDVAISTSFSSLKRLMLEAVAFGCFLWETEEYINDVYKLSENL